MYLHIPSSLFEIEPDFLRSQSGSRSREQILGNGEPSKPTKSQVSPSSETSALVSISQALRPLSSLNKKSAGDAHDSSNGAWSIYSTRKTIPRLVSEAIDVAESNDDNFLSSWLESDAALSFSSLFGNLHDDPNRREEDHGPRVRNDDHY